MIYVSLKGRMCNQMFQIAAAKSLSIDNSVDFVCDNNILGITPSAKETTMYKKTIFRNVSFTNLYSNYYKIHKEPDNFSYKKIKYENKLLLTGYYQSEKYFIHNQKEIRKFYECPKGIEDFINENFTDLLERQDTCSVHIRRGDYLKYKDFHTNLSPDYYNFCFEKKEGSHFVFFSDDIEWCKKTFKNKEATFIHTNLDVVDFYLMSRMKDNIIANSSFSWWAAWLNNNKNKHIMAPKKWFGPANNGLTTKDLIPEKWEIINA